MDFERLIATLNDYIIVASVIVIVIRKLINCAALIIVFSNHTIVKCIILYILSYLQHFVNECYSIL